MTFSKVFLICMFKDIVWKKAGKIYRKSEKEEKYGPRVVGRGK